MLGVSNGVVQAFSFVVVCPRPSIMSRPAQEATHEGEPDGEPDKEEEWRSKGAEKLQ